MLGTLQLLLSELCDLIREESSLKEMKNADDDDGDDD